MEKIGRHVYNQLRSMKSLTNEQLKQVMEYESGAARQLTKEQKQKIEDYKAKLFSSPEQDEMPKISEGQMLEAFQHYYKIQNPKSKDGFIFTDETKKNLQAVVLYFLKDDRFFNSERLINISEPSFSKGLWIVGSYGNGKTSIMNAIKMVMTSMGRGFSIRNTNNVVTDFEACHEPEDKVTFWYRASRGNILFDDLKAERMASNYGKVNIMKDVLEKRALVNVTTHATFNYREGSESVEDAILEIGEKYGSRVYDRIFHMANIIEFKGKSMRR